MHSKYRFPLFVGHFVNHRVPSVARIVHDDIEAAEFFYRCVDDRVGKSASGDVTRNALRSPACRKNGSHSLFRGSRVDVAQYYVRTMPRKKFGGGAADSATSSSDDCCLSLKKSFHVFLRDS